MTNRTEVPPSTGLNSASSAKASMMPRPNPPSRCCTSGADTSGSEVSITGGGFLFDRASGQYVQQVTLRNTGTVPISKPLKLVLTGLPNGVKLAEADGITKNVAPLGSPYADAGTFSKKILPPGQSVTLTLRFFNYNNQSITYTPKLYTGNKL